MQPIVLVLVPPDWEAVPEGLDALRRQIETGYDGRMVLRPATQKLSRPVVLLFGSWDAAAKARATETLHWLAQEAFFTLEWLKGVI